MNILIHGMNLTKNCFQLKNFQFFSKLNKRIITDIDCRHAKRMWNRFDM